jgi:hypothetical protein
MIRLPAVPKGYERFFRRCTVHKRTFYYHAVPYSLSNPVMSVPCGCDIRSLKTVSEKEGRRQIERERARDEREKNRTRSRREIFYAMLDKLKELNCGNKVGDLAELIAEAELFDQQRNRKRPRRRT